MRDTVKGYYHWCCDFWTITDYLSMSITKRILMCIYFCPTKHLITILYMKMIFEQNYQNTWHSKPQSFFLCLNFFHMLRKSKIHVRTILCLVLFENYLRICKYWDRVEVSPFFSPYLAFMWSEVYFSLGNVFFCGLSLTLTPLRLKCHYLISWIGRQRWKLAWGCN